LIFSQCKIAQHAILENQALPATDMTNIDSAAPGDPRRLFDLDDSEGINESERILTRLCRRSFLRLWALSNTFTDEGFKDGKGGTKELCDSLIVFGNDVIIFSDKHINFQHDKRLEVAWPRWYKRAVIESCRQLRGAMGWLTRFPGRAFLDAKCTRRLPVPVPSNNAVRFHLVAVTRGTRDAVLRANEGQGLGSFAVNTSVVGTAHLTSPFTVGIPEPGRYFVHVFDEVSIELVMSELDTAADFIDYLKERERLLGRVGSVVVAFGEEDLLAAYLQTMNSARNKHAFFNIVDGGRQPDMAMFDATFYEGLTTNLAYLRKKQADQVSYDWDGLIDRFLDFGDPDLHTGLLVRKRAANPS
jgi:hypothetical protein